MSNNNFSSFDFMFSDNPNKGIFEALDTYKTPKDTFVIPEISNNEQEELAEQVARARVRRNDKTYVRNHIFRESLKNDTPTDHISYLEKLKSESMAECTENKDKSSTHPMVMMWSAEFPEGRLVPLRQPAPPVYFQPQN